MRLLKRLFVRESEPRSLVPRLPANDEILAEATRRAQKVAKSSRHLEPAFPALGADATLDLDTEEEQWCSRELSETGLSREDYPPEVWEQIVTTFGVSNGLQKAAESRLRGGDYTGALQSWVKWIHTWSPGLPGRPVDYVAKEDWLILIKIYIGLCRAEDAQRALFWAKAVGDAEERPRRISRDMWADRKANWERDLEEVRAGIDGLAG